MVKAMFAAIILAGTGTVAFAQSASAPLLVTASVVSSCTMEVPRQVDRSGLTTMPVGIVCARRNGQRRQPARVQRPPSPRRSVEASVLHVDF
jgi:hypothetical protein